MLIHKIHIAHMVSCAIFALIWIKLQYWFGACGGINARITTIIRRSRICDAPAIGVTFALINVSLLNYRLLLRLLGPVVL
jgi:hypothetical protein